ncbi:MAG TPA: MBL fold metallo-hydrolase [Syntrophorhabdaceae bacterium]|nr:MBL fold metallo-hydrolase [Syntrophorhabdaceae bacterium]
MMFETAMKRVVVRISHLVALGIVCLFLTIPSYSWSADDFKITLLGTGTPVPSPDLFGPSTLIEAGGQRLVFDLGRGCTIRLWQQQISLGSINAHFLTHLHSDHINGLPDIYLSGWIQTPFGGRKSPFVIFGPPGTQKMMANLWEAFSEDRRIRLEDEKNPLAGIQAQAQDYKPGIVYDKNGVVVTVFEVDHGDLVKPCYGFKITYKNHSVVISGDTRYNINVEKAASGADLLIHEVTMVPEKLLADYPVYRAIIDHHISPEEAGKLFSKTKPRLAVYTHLVLSGLPAKGIPFPTHEELLAATRKTYDGRVLIGKDLMSFKIDDTGVSVIEPPRR